jgi:hypothetical protein
MSNPKRTLSARSSSDIFACARHLNPHLAIPKSLKAQDEFARAMEERLRTWASVMGDPDLLADPTVGCNRKVSP